MNLANFLSIVQVRWRIVLAVIIATTLTALVVSLMVTPKYLAQASVVIDIKPDPITSFLAPSLSPAYLNTQADVINSDRVALRVVSDLKLAQNQDIRQQWLDATDGKGSFEQWLANTLQVGLDVKPSRESNVIMVNYKGKEPNFTAALANAFVAAYLETTLDLRVDPARKYSSFFDESSKAARQKLENAQAKLSAFQHENGIVVDDERLDVELTRLSELTSQLVTLQALADDANSRRTQAAGASADRTQEVLNSPVVAQLKSDLSRAEARLQELKTRYGDSYPDVVQAAASATELRARLDAEIKRISGGTVVTSTINDRRVADTRAAVAEQRTKVLHIKAVRDQGAVLMRDVESAQRAYEDINQRRTQAGLESRTTQTNINVLTEAYPPTSPSFPKIPLNTAIGLVVGAVLGLGIVVALEFLERRVRVVEDVVTALQLPLLGVLPKPGARRRSGPRRLNLMEQRVLGSTAAGKGAT